MKIIGQLVKRNILIYIRDKGAVFFSLLSMIIVLALMLIFLGDSNKQAVLGILNDTYGGIRDTDLDTKNVENLIQMWTIAGILMVNAVTVSLTMMGFMVIDREDKKLDSFYTAPVKRYKIVLGYILSAIVVATAICIITLVIAEVWVVVSGGQLLSWTAIGKTLLVVLENVFLWSGVMFLLATFVHSESAWNALATVTGTLIGFVGGIYLPMGMLPEAVQAVLKGIPALHGAAVIRQLFTEEIAGKTFAGISAEVVDEYNKYMGVTVEVNEKVLSFGTEIVILAVFGIIIFSVAALLFSRKKK